MLLTIFNVFYVLVAVAMIILILLQRGAGAQAGSGFGGGASATVFGSRGATTFLSRATAMLAGVFFLLSLLMGIYLHPTASQTQSDLGVMSGVGTPEPAKPEVSVPASDVPAAPAAQGGSDKPAPTPAAADKPAAPAPAAPEKKDGGGGKSEPKKN
jgi:preprotein translocase subunit SecG